MGADVDTAGLAQADANITIENNRETSRFIDPLFTNKRAEPREAARPACDYYTTVLCLLFICYSSFQ
jgi:hypothetical protein